MRIMVTGSRFFSTPQPLVDALIAHAAGTPVLVHGRCDPREPWGKRLLVPWNRAMLLPMDQQRLMLGADWQAHLYAEGHGWTEEHHPANWREHGRRAGMLRNAAMVAAGANVAVACIEPGEGCVGTRHCARLAEKAGIRVVWVPPTLDGANLGAYTSP